MEEKGTNEEVTYYAYSFEILSEIYFQGTKFQRHCQNIKQTKTRQM